MEQQYIAKERCGVFPEGGIEYYLIARSKLASGLMEAAKKGDLPPNQLLVVAVHLKVCFEGWVFPIMRSVEEARSFYSALGIDFASKASTHSSHR